MVQEDVDPAHEAARLVDEMSAVVQAAASEPIDASTGDVVRRRVLDTAGAAWAARPVLAPALRRAATLLGADGPRPLLDHVAGLSAITRSSEVDDVELVSCVTPGSAVIPPALVLAADRGISDDRFIRAILAGYEVMISLGRRIGGAHVLRAGVWPSNLLAPIGAAAVAAVLWDLDARDTRAALAGAASRSVSGMPRVIGEPSGRWYSFGNAVAAGVSAAAGAAAGVRSEPTLPAMFWPLLSRPRAASTPDDGTSPWVIREVDVKPFCTARQTQSAVEAARVAAADVDAEAIEGVIVEVPEAYVTMIDRPDPHVRMDSIASAQYQVACGLAAPQALYDVVRHDLASTADVTHLMNRLSIRSAADLADRYPAAWGARVTVRTSRGDAVAEVLHPAGSFRAGGLDWDALVRKQAALGVPADVRAGLLAVCRTSTRFEGAHAQQVLQLLDWGSE